MNTKEAGLKYIEKGFYVLPIVPKGKRPILTEWQNNCSLDKDKVTSWFDNNDNNIGIVTGKKSGILVIDIDKKESADGLKSIAEMESVLVSYLPSTVTARTQSGGIHLFYKYPSGIQHIAGKIGILPSVDTRADGNQCVVYPSVGEKGDYTWIHAPWDMELQPLPLAWKKFLCGEIDREQAGKIKLQKKFFVLPDKIFNGERNATLLSYSASLADKKGMDATQLTGAIKEANAKNCVTPLNDSEIANIIKWGVDKIGKRTAPEVPENMPDWVTMGSRGDYSINDGMFCKEYKANHLFVCVNNIFYDANGSVDTSKVKQDIQRLVAPFMSMGLAGKVTMLLEGLRNECYIPAPKPTRNVVHTKFKSLKVDLSGYYETQPEFTLNRLDVEYQSDALCPRWKNFLDSLLEKEDIVTLQEYLGYCLVPVTSAQKALFVIGQGGEGKSVLGEVIHYLFGNNMIQGELHKLQENRFMLANLDNKLVFYDDDLQSQALSDTGTFKKLVTASIPILVEQKGLPYYQMLPFARIICCGNTPISACYDHTEGFYRRLIVLKCKPKPDDRIDDKLLAKKIGDTEISGILNWALEGLYRLVANNWQFTISAQTSDNVQEAKEDSFNIISYLKDENRIIYSDTVEATISRLYDDYIDWCDDNACNPLAKITFSKYLKIEATKEHGLKYCTSVLDGEKRSRGYIGIGIIHTPKKAYSFKTS